MISKAEPPFVTLPYRAGVDKDINVIGPDGLSFSVDFDDVDHHIIETALEKMMRILNEHWDD